MAKPQDIEHTVAEAVVESAPVKEITKNEFTEVKANMNSFTYDIPHDFLSEIAEDAKIQSPFLFYTEEGEYLAGPVKDLEKIYITTESIKRVDTKTKEDWETAKANACILNNGVDSDGISYKDFKHFAATVFGESAAGFNVVIKEEIYALASAINNFKKWYKKKKKKDISYRKTITETGAYSVSNPQYRKYIKASETKHNSSIALKYANAAVINAINGGVDHSNGATKWSGIDIVSASEKWKEGYKFTAVSHDHFFLGNYKKSGKEFVRDINNKKTKTVKDEWDYKWESTAAFSGVNCDKINTLWNDYKDNTKNPEAALTNYSTFIIAGGIDEVKKKIFFENETANKFGTVFCKQTQDYIDGQGGEFY